MRLFSVALACLALAGCASWPFGEPEPPPPFDVVVTHAKPSVPPECSPSGDPKWKNLPDADVPRSAAARNYKGNKDQFTKLSGKRSVCGDALKAQGML